MNPQNEIPEVEGAPTERTNLLSRISEVISQNQTFGNDLFKKGASQILTPIRNLTKTPPEFDQIYQKDQFISELWNMRSQSYRKPEILEFAEDILRNTELELNDGLIEAMAKVLVDDHTGMSIGGTKAVSYFSAMQISRIISEDRLDHELVGVLAEITYDSDLLEERLQKVEAREFRMLICINAIRSIASSNYMELVVVPNTITDEFANKFVEHSKFILKPIRGGSNKYGTWVRLSF